MTIFLLTYVNRSGSTYLANLLSASDKICVCPEGDKLVNLFLEAPEKPFTLNTRWIAKLGQIFQSDPKLKNWGIDDLIYTHLQGVDNNFDAFLAILRYYQAMLKPGAVSILFKAERLVDLFYAIDKAKRPGLNVKYLSLIRDPRAVYESQKRTLIPGTSKRMSSNPVFTAIFWNHFIRRVMNNNKHLNSFQIFYHELVRNLEDSLSKLKVLLDIDFGLLTPNQGDLADRLPDGHNSIHQDLNKIPNEQKINSWKEKCTNEEILLIERKCKKYLIEFGFEISENRYAGPGVEFKVFYFSMIYWLKQFISILRFHILRLFIEK